MGIADTVSWPVIAVVRALMSRIAGVCACVCHPAGREPLQHLHQLRQLRPIVVVRDAVHHDAHVHGADVVPGQGAAVRVRCADAPPVLFPAVVLA